MNDLSLLREVLTLTGEEAHLTPSQKREASRIIREFIKPVIDLAGIEMSGHITARATAYRYRPEDGTEVRINIVLPVKIRSTNWRNGTVRISPSLLFKNGIWSARQKASEATYVWPSDYTGAREHVAFGKEICDAIYRAFDVYKDR